MKELKTPDDAVLADLLEQAGPRPAPSEAATEQARQVLHAKWQSLLRQQRRRYWLMAASIAAVGVLVAFAATNLLAPTPQATAIAGVAKARGAIFLRSDESGLLELRSPMKVSAGQVLVTAEDSALSLAWIGGASLRMDESTELRFISTDAVELRRGRLYFDSGTDAGSVRIDISTDFGVVSNHGTQFMVNAGLDALTVNVREGSVTFVGRFYDETVHSGERISVAGSDRPARTNEPGYGAEWQWTESMTPATRFDGESEHAFFVWVSRETGHRLVYASDGLETEARRETLHGLVDQAPREALSQRVLTTGLRARFESGELIISK